MLSLEDESGVSIKSDSREEATILASCSHVQDGEGVAEAFAASVSSFLKQLVPLHRQGWQEEGSGITLQSSRRVALPPPTAPSTDGHCGPGGHQPEALIEHLLHASIMPGAGMETWSCLLSEQRSKPDMHHPQQWLRALGYDGAFPS